MKESLKNQQIIQNPPQLLFKLPEYPNCFRFKALAANKTANKSRHTRNQNLKWLQDLRELRNEIAGKCETRKLILHYWFSFALSFQL